MHLGNLIGDQAMRPTMYLGGGLGVGGLDQAENSASTFIEPILKVAHVELLLGREVCLVRALDGLGR